MEDKATPLEVLLERAENYSKTSIKLFKLKTIDKTAEIISTLISWMVVITVVALFFMILNIGIAFWIGELLGKTYYGFFIVAAFYALLGIVFKLFSTQWIKKPMRNSIVSQMIK
jgi:hypothetical protein